MSLLTDETLSGFWNNIFCSVKSLTDMKADERLQSCSVSTMVVSGTPGVYQFYKHLMSVGRKKTGRQ